jgi:hypothetical protein
MMYSFWTKYLGLATGHVWGAIEIVVSSFLHSTWSHMVHSSCSTVTYELGSLYPHSMSSLVCGSVFQQAIDIHRLWLTRNLWFQHVSCFFQLLPMVVPIDSDQLGGLEDQSWHFYWTLFSRDRITSCRSQRRPEIWCCKEQNIWRRLMFFLESCTTLYGLGELYGIITIHTGIYFPTRPTFSHCFSY